MELQEIIKEMRDSAEHNHLDIAKIAEDFKSGNSLKNSVMKRLNRNPATVDGVNMWLQFSVTPLPSKRQLEILSLSPEVKDTELPNVVVSKVANMFFPGMLGVYEIPLEMRKETYEVCDEKLPIALASTRQFMRMI